MAYIFSIFLRICMSSYTYLAYMWHLMDILIPVKYMAIGCEINVTSLVFLVICAEMEGLYIEVQWPIYVQCGNNI